MSRLVLLFTSPRLPAGLLSADAWDVLRSSPVLTADAASPQLAPLRAAGVPVTVLDETTTPAAATARLLAAAGAGTATWLVGADGDPSIADAVTGLASLPPVDGPVTVEVMHGSWDLPGARLIEVVTTMDRLRSPGGCPWDAAQDHASLGPYLLEEAYEAFQAIEDDDAASLVEELGDVLLQVAFHARLAEERAEGERWTIDDVATGLVEKLVRRHPHVFADAVAAAPTDAQAGWDAIKATERGQASALASVPLALPALTLAATVQRKASRFGVPEDLLVPELAEAGASEALVALAAELERAPSIAATASLLWAVVGRARAAGIDAEAALRVRAREVRAAVMAVESAARDDDADPATLDRATWARQWPGSAS
ncbi:MAG TPA: MazG family protein [Mycobacteriales bacterium]|nr:MazG family protein [Mycobacteriales bacterium]